MGVPMDSDECRSTSMTAVMVAAGKGMPAAADYACRHACSNGAAPALFRAVDPQVFARFRTVDMTGERKAA